MTLLALIESTDTDQWVQAQCLSVDPNMMQPDRATEDEVEQAKAVCAGCPLFDACHDHAEAQAPAYGVHAGEWWGDDPVWQVVKACEHAECGREFRVDRDTRQGQRARFCKAACRVAAHRAGKVSA